MESLVTAAMISETSEWAALRSHFDDVRKRHLRDLFANDPERASVLSVEADGVYLDYSKNRLTAETIRLLVALAERAGLHRRIDAMFGGERINTTEQRAVLHVALRAPESESILLDGTDVVPFRRFWRLQTCYGHGPVPWCRPRQPISRPTGSQIC